MRCAPQVGGARRDRPPVPKAALRPREGAGSNRSAAALPSRAPRCPAGPGPESRPIADRRATLLPPLFARRSGPAAW